MPGQQPGPSQGSAAEPGPHVGHFGPGAFPNQGSPGPSSASITPEPSASSSEQIDAPYWPQTVSVVLFVIPLANMVSLARTPSNLSLLAEVISTSSDAYTDVLSFEAPIDSQIEAFLNNGEAVRQKSAIRIARIPGEVLATGMTRLVKNEQSVIVALTQDGLWSEGPERGPTRDVEFSSLEQHPVSARRPAGSLVVIPERDAASSLAFGTNHLTSGYLLQSGQLTPLKGVPVAYSQGELLLAKYREGEDVFDGSVRFDSRVHDLGPFLKIQETENGFVVQRPDLSFELYDAQLDNKRELQVHSGNAWGELAGTWVSSTQTPWGGSDSLSFASRNGITEVFDYDTSITALALVKNPAGIVVAEAPSAGTSTVSLIEMPLP